MQKYVLVLSIIGMIAVSVVAIVSMYKVTILHMAYVEKRALMLKDMTAIALSEADSIIELVTRRNIKGDK